MRIKTLGLWSALLISSFALVAGGCGGDDEGTGTGATTGEGGAEAAEQVITVNWGSEPPSLDPGLATDTTSANILLNIMDPLVELDEDLNPVPAAAESFETSEDGKTVTFVLRDDLKWTNGDPVTAGDFEYAWKRTVSPELGADYAYQFYGIVGAQDYNSCDPKKDDCAALADKMGVKAVDDKTLEVTLTTPQPWFTQQVAHHSFLAVHKATVDKFGDKWTEAANIVTNGPFKLESWEHNSAIDLVKDDDWRDADSVKLTRVNGRLINDPITAVQAFEAGEVDVLYQALPPAEISRLKDTPEYEQYPGLGNFYYAFNVENIPDVKQRRAMSLAIPRQSIIDNIAQGGQRPSTGFTPEGMPGFDVINPESPWLPAEPDVEQAKQLMSEVANPKTNDHALHERLGCEPGHRGRGPGRAEGDRDRQHDQAAGVPAVPGVPRAAAEQGRRRVPARLDRRLRRRDQLPRAVDVRVGQQLDELLQQGVRRADREGARHPGQRRPLRALRAGGGASSSARTATCRSRRSTTTPTRTSSGRTSRRRSRSTCSTRPT